jgi:hypothetical protein
MANEVNEAEEWLVETLKANPTLMELVAGVHTGSVPAEDHAGDYPCVLIQYARGYDFLLIGRPRLMTDALFSVRGIALERDSGDLPTIADEIDKALDRKGTDGIRCWRQEPFRLDEVENGVKYLHDGGLYRVQVQTR